MMSSNDEGHKDQGLDGLRKDTCAESVEMKRERARERAELMHLSMSYYHFETLALPQLCLINICEVERQTREKMLRGQYRSTAEYTH